jgi:hypothetical protein
VAKWRFQENPGTPADVGEPVEDSRGEVVVRREVEAEDAWGTGWKLKHAAEAAEWCQAHAEERARRKAYAEATRRAAEEEAARREAQMEAVRQRKKRQRSRLTEVHH